MGGSQYEIDILAPMFCTLMKHSYGAYGRGRAASLSAILAVVLVGYGLPSCGGETVVKGPKHVILISLDTLRADHIGAYGNSSDLTPTIDSLAESGITFDNVLAPAPTTLASHTSMLTGQYPQTHGVVRNGYPVHADNVTLAERLKQEGFHTAAFLGSFALDSSFGLDQGFEVYDETFNMKVEGGRDQNQRRANQVTDAALEHLARVKDDADRLFFFVHYFDAHLPYEPELKMAKRYTVDENVVRIDDHQIDAIVRRRHKAQLGLKKGDDRFGLNKTVVQGLSADHLSKADGKPFAIERVPASLYNAEVATVDAAIAKLLGGLAQQGILDDCLIILTGDHGETFWEHGDSWNHGLWLYRTTTHLPWIMSWRGAPWKPGTRIPAPSSTVDLAPTLCALLGIPVLEALDGMDWGPVFEGQAFERGPVFSVATQPLDPQLERASPHWANAHKPHAVQLGPWKLIDSKYNSVQELFHLGQDPGERNNLLAGENLQEEVKAAFEQLSGLLIEFRASARPLPSQFDARQSIGIAARLQAMGYGDKDTAGD
ncbi:MAG: arylsulfatase A-like enzyme [Planctomycetota bacterium]|jgi:arylsulfatase A-like enzyme